ncbi:MAG: UvrD-helicase domain-containing protein [Bacteroidaceae bacterium]|nr:UvrD-helicase domain-containing protein [Bacteroidaceae bacterium]
MELLIYKASAGSGKTFTLAVEYIKLLIINPTAYRHILAVTFTNKATTEMKERIMQQLWGISQGDEGSKPYLQALSEHLQQAGYTFSTAEIRHRAGDAMHRILHEYNRFQVTTIDSFFQILTRNLARELGIGSHLNIELDTTAVLNEAIDNMIAKLDEHSAELSWILSYIDTKINDASQWQVAKELKSFGEHIFKEDFVEKSKQLHEQLKDIKLIEQYQQQLKLLKEESLNELKKFKERFTDIIDKNHISLDSDLKYGNNVKGYFDKLTNKYDDDSMPGARIIERMTDVNSWVKPNSKQKAHATDVAQNHLMPLLIEAEKYRSNAICTIHSCDMATRYLYQLQLINAIREAVTNENHEKNRFLLADTNQLLGSLISERDSSFIYEKIGASINHIMIDEFQDTSRMQWNNFKPLVDEGLAQGSDSLIVGDVKQSIYRWRNGDWNILNNMRKQETPIRIRIEPLSTNYRSEVRIIQFNNHLFKQLVQNLNNQYKEELHQDCEPLLNAYSDVKQLIKKKQTEGYVKVSFIKNETGEDSNTYVSQTISAMGDEIKRLQEKGIPLNQMVILLRSKRHIGKIATWLNEELHIPVVSNEAFRLDASSAIHIIINALRFLSDADDHIAEAALKTDYQQLVLKHDNISLHTLLTSPSEELLPASFISRRGELQQMPLYELIEELFNIFSLQQIDQQEAYLFTFYDAVSEYLSDHSSELTAFLQYWDDRLSKNNIPSGEIDGIRIMTVHKAKGLEFHTVLVPFCDWSLTIEGNNDQLIWCSPQEDPYNKLNVVPVRYTKKMLQSAFKDDFLHERLQLWVDNLNILYVALTRAEKNMIIFSNSKSSGGKISDLLRTAIPEIAIELEATLDDDQNTFEYGELTEYHAQQKTTSQNLLAQKPSPLNIQMVSRHPDIEFRESNRSADFIAGIDEAASASRFMNRGSILHTLFASIRTITDIEPAINSLVAEGIVGGIVSEAEIRNEVKQAFALPAIQPWYDGTWQLFNECDIICMNNDKLQQYRPDRVMLRGDEMIVVDFKFGKPKKSHNRQVQTYIDLLTHMNYRNITGYLWYVDENQVVKV